MTTSISVTVTISPEQDNDPFLSFVGVWNAPVFVQVTRPLMVTRGPVVTVPAALRYIFSEPSHGSDGQHAYLERALARATLVHLEDDDEYYAAIPGFQGLYGTGDTESEALHDLRGALKAWLQVRRTRRLPVPAVE